MAARFSAKWLAAAALAVAAIPGHAQQYSDAYTFLKAVKERDGDKATQMISQPGSIVVNTKDRSSGEGAVHIVTRERDANWLWFLLSKGARPDLSNKEGNGPLHIAAQIGWIEGAERLLGYKASVDLRNNRGETPLILAVHNRDLAMAQLLMKYGADPKRQDSAAGYSALDYARQDGRSTALIKLLEAPAAPAKKVAGPTL